MPAEYIKQSDGSFKQIGNSGAGGDIYSTEETLVGRWLNGKDIYKKTVFRDTTLRAYTSGTLVNGVFGSATYVDEVVNIEWTFKEADSSWVAGTTTINSAGQSTSTFYGALLYYFATQDSIVLEGSTKFLNAQKKNMTVTMYYTKT